MANTIDYPEKIQGFIDEELEHGSYTQWMTPNEDRIEYTGGKDIKIARVATSGLGNYKNGASGLRYPIGTVKLEWDTYQMEMDRAVRFELGRTDPADTGFIMTTENVTREFARRQLVPEQDIFRFNRVYTALAASAKYKDTHIVKPTAAFADGLEFTKSITQTLSLVKEDSNSDIDFVCFAAMDLEPLLRDASKNNHHGIEFGKTVSINGYSYRCALVNELPVVFVPSRRLQTVIKVNDGQTDGQTDGGIVKDTTSKRIEYLITSSNAPIAASKVDSLKVFSANEMQDSDETTINYHLRYDCWTQTNQLATTAACVVSA